MDGQDNCYKAHFNSFLLLKGRIIIEMKWEKTSHGINMGYINCFHRDTENGTGYYHRHKYRVKVSCRSRNRDSAIRAEGYEAVTMEAEQGQEVWGTGKGSPSIMLIRNLDTVA